MSEVDFDLDYYGLSVCCDMLADGLLLKLPEYPGIMCSRTSKHAQNPIISRFQISSFSSTIILTRRQAFLLPNVPSMHK